MTRSMLNPANRSLIIYNETDRYDGEGLYLLYRDGKFIPERLQSVCGTLLNSTSKPPIGQIVGRAIATVNFFAPP
ncbi:MAG: hypothetical protein IKK79_08700, partial [Spirochaetaceae bacterium]|nr:hypothetical protein [Spirochaetaceae bacterium]